MPTVLLFGAGLIAIAVLSLSAPQFLYVGAVLLVFFTWKIWRILQLRHLAKRLKAIRLKVAEFLIVEQPFTFQVEVDSVQEINLDHISLVCELPVKGGSILIKTLRLTQFSDDSEGFTHVHGVAPAIPRWGFASFVWFVRIRVAGFDYLFPVQLKSPPVYSHSKPAGMRNA